MNPRWDDWHLDDEEEDASVIYFVQDSDRLAIKIDCVKDNTVEKRRGELQVGNPSALVILATLPGGREEEKALHLRFAQARVRGEWFRPVPELIKLIAEADPWQEVNYEIEGPPIPHNRNRRVEPSTRPRHQSKRMGRPPVAIEAACRFLTAI